MPKIKRLKPKYQDLCIESLATDSRLGYCRYCGCEHENCDPDQRDTKCEECGKQGVCGPEHLIETYAL